MKKTQSIKYTADDDDDRDDIEKLLSRLKISIANRNNNNNNNNNNDDKKEKKSEEKSKELTIENSKGKKIKIEIINTIEDLKTTTKQITEYLTSLPRELKMIAVDLEGVKLGRSGTISLLQLYPYNHDVIYIIDVLILKRSAFEVYPNSLKSLLESSEIKKIMFDPRADSDALYGQYDVYLEGVICCQLMNAVYHSFIRRQNMKYVMGLAKAIEKDLSLNLSLRLKFQAIKSKGKDWFNSYEIFLDRPISDDLIYYSSFDVVLLFDLYDFYFPLITSKMHIVIEESKNRVDFCKKKVFFSDARCPSSCQSNDYIFRSRFREFNFDDDYEYYY